MEINKSKNVNVGSVNTNGGKFHLGDNYYKSIEYKELIKAIARLEKLIELTFDEKERRDYYKELEEEKRKLEEFKEGVISLAKIFQRITVNNERLKLARKYFEVGEFNMTRAVLDIEKMDQELEGLLLKKLELADNASINNKQLEEKSEEFLILAKLTSINYSLPNRYESTIEAYEKSISAKRSLDNFYNYAYFLLIHHTFDKSRKLFEELNDLIDDEYSDDEGARKYKAGSLANISNILRRTGFYKESLAKRIEALNLQKQIYDKESEEILLSKYNLSLTYSKLDNREKALMYLSEVNDGFDNQCESGNKELNKEFNKGHILNAGGVIYAEAGRMKEAIPWFIDAFEFRKMIKTDDEALDLALASESAHNTAKALYHEGEYNKAKQFALIADGLIKKAMLIDSLRFINDNNRNDNLLLKLYEM
jgi:tetratricopeptide (TPR) repeat protein